MKRRRAMMVRGEEEPIECLKFTALQAGTFTFKISRYTTTAMYEYIEYSTDNGETWVRTNNVNNTQVTVTTPTIAVGGTVLWRGKGSQLNTDYSYSTSSSAKISYFSSTGTFECYGDVMSLYGKSKISSNYAFSCLFADCKITKAPTLSATTLTDYCYAYMFSNCTSLTVAPELQATTLACFCCLGMFSKCSGLTTAPTLSATTLAEGCYSNMFIRCTSLVTAPSLPATTLASSCYYGMFRGCASLVTAPSLPATTLVSYCYSSMFYECTSLVTAPSLPSTTLADGCYDSMFYECASLVTAPSLPATTLASSCYSGMFTGCASLVTAPSLPATTLASACYYSMFYECTSLVTAPSLPATTLVSYCYGGMFRGCTSLNYIKAMFTTSPSSSYTSNWVYGVASSGTFVKNSAATWNVTDYNGIPSGWTVQTADS